MQIAVPRGSLILLSFKLRRFPPAPSQQGAMLKMNGGRGRDSNWEGSLGRLKIEDLETACRF